MRTTLALPVLTLLIGLLLLAHPSLANRFETISGGVSGSVTLKRQCQWPIILTPLRPIKLTHPGRQKISSRVCASVDSSHLPA